MSDIEVLAAGLKVVERSLASQERDHRKYLDKVLREGTYDQIKNAVRYDRKAADRIMRFVRKHLCDSDGDLRTRWTEVLVRGL